MPLRVSCLQKDTELKDALFDVIEEGVLIRAAAGKSTSLQGIFRDLRNAGVEVDIETVGFIYNEVFKGEPGFTSTEDVEIISTRAYKDAVNRLAENEKLVGEKQISEQPAETAVATLITDALYKDIVEDERTVSDQRVLQDALWKGVRRLLGPLQGKKADKKTMTGLIDEALGWEQKGIVDVNGRLNSISDLFYAMREKVREAANEVRSESQDNFAIEQLNEYIKHLENATYKLLFSRQEGKQVLTDAMKEAGFGKTLKSGNTVIDWNKLAGNSGNISDLRTNVDIALTKAGYSPAVIERIKDTLENEFIEMRAEIVDRQMNAPEKFAAEGARDVKAEAGLNAMLAGKSVAEWIKKEKVENVEDLHDRAMAALAGKKYEQEVMNRIFARLNKFFESNYVKVTGEEAQRVVYDILGGKPEDGGKTALQWIKENGIQNQGELDAALEKSLSTRTVSPLNVQKIKDAFTEILDINNRAENELVGREKRALKEYATRKSDMHRLVELYHLGVFEGSHNSLLYNVIGVNDLQAKDLEDLEQISKVASDMSRMIADPKSEFGKIFDDVFASREFQRLQRLIDSIVSRNINNKSTLLKIIAGIKNFLDVMLSSLLGMPSTIVQNILSGVQAVLTGIRFNAGEGGWARTKQAFDIYFSMLKHVGSTGQAYGEEIGSFATQELFTNSLKWKWKDASVLGKAKSVLYAATAHIRIGLLAFDSANKVALTNKVFYNTMFKSLISSGMTKEGAAQFLNESLYGQKFEDAKVMARKLIEENNSKLDAKFRSKVSNAEVTSLANDIVKANLNTDTNISKDILSIALKSSYHVAGLGLGHEPNNIASRGIKQVRDWLHNKEKGYVNDKNWSGLAAHRMMSVFVNTFIIRFAGGATNWLWLRAKHGLGLGLVSGLFRMNKELDFTDTRSLKENIKDRQNARNDIARGLIGGLYTGVSFALGSALTGGAGGSDDDKERLAYLEKLKEKTMAQREEIERLKSSRSVYAKIKENRRKLRWFKAVSPDIMLIKFYSETSKSGEGFAEYFYNTYAGDDRFSAPNKLRDYLTLSTRGDKGAAQGKLASIAGDQVGIPLIRNYVEWFHVLTGNPFKEQKPYIAPQSWQEGLFGGGVMEQMGLYKPETKITAIPGVGVKTYDRLKKKGISDMGDIKDNPTWYNKKDDEGYILDAPARVQAKKFTEAYLK